MSYTPEQIIREHKLYLLGISETRSHLFKIFEDLERFKKPLSDYIYYGKKNSVIFFLDIDRRHIILSYDIFNIIYDDVGTDEIRPSDINTKNLSKYIINYYYKDIPKDWVLVKTSHVSTNYRQI